MSLILSVAAAAVSISLLPPGGVSTAGDDVIESFTEHYRSLGGCVVEIGRMMEADDSMFGMIGGDRRAYNAIVIRPNRVIFWPEGAGGAVQMPTPIVSTMGETRYEAIGAPVNAYTQGPNPDSFDDMVTPTDAEGDEPRVTPMAMIPGSMDLLALFSESGPTFSGTPLGDFEYAGTAGEDLDIVHVFKGETTDEAHGGSQAVEVHIDAGKTPTLRRIIADVTLTVMTGAGDQSHIDATVTTDFADWMEIPRAEPAEGATEVDDIMETMRKRMDAMGLHRGND